LADASATTVVFMGRRTFARLYAALAAHGLPAETPALLAEAIGGSEQSLWRGTVGDLAQLLDDAPHPAPALILYGPLADGPHAPDTP
jgi:uroporphyrin-III C-methyltransferase